MNSEGIDRFLERIAGTEGEELSCSECFDMLDTAVEHELSGRGETPGWRRFTQHLEQCPVCREEYEILKEFIRAEANQPERPPDT
jgi:hypothetical protein